MSAFDPTVFIGQVTTEAGKTEYKPCPEGDYRMSIVADEKGLTVRVTPQGTPILEVSCSVDDPAVKEALNTDEVRVKLGMFLDLNSEGKLAWGQNQNLQLARLREYVGQNEAGKPWSPKMLVGAGPFIGTVKHRADPNDPSRVFAEVKGVAPVSRRGR